MVSLREFRVLVLGSWRLGPGRLLQRSSELITTLPWESETRRSDDIIYQIQARFLEVDLVVIFTYSCSIIAQHVRYGTFRNICGRTHQSYTVGLLGVPGASPPSAILPFRRSFFQPSPLGVVAAASGWQRTEIQQHQPGVKRCTSFRFRIYSIQLSKSSLNWLQIS